MRGPSLVRFSRRMQRIGKQQQSIRHRRIFRRGHRRLPAPIRMTARDHLLRSRSHQSRRIPNPLPVARCRGRKRRPVRTSLPIRQIVPQHQKSGSGKSIAQCAKQRCVAIRSRAMRQHDPCSSECCRLMPPLHRSPLSPTRSAARLLCTAQSPDTAGIR